jgi:hypothetical protein
MVTSRLLQTSDLAEKPGQNCCASNSCLKANVEGLVYCEMHLMSTPDRSIVHGVHEGIKDQLKNVIKLLWNSDESLKQIWELSKEIQKGQAPETRLICLDLEYSWASRKIFEVGICEYVSGRTIANLRIRHDCTFEELCQEFS